MKLVLFARIVLRRWWLLPLFAALGLGIAYFWSSRAPERYESVVTLQLNPAGKSALLPYAAEARADRVTTLAASYLEVLRSRAFGEIVVRELGLNTTPGAIAEAINARLIPNTNIFRLA